MQQWIVTVFIEIEENLVGCCLQDEGFDKLHHPHVETYRSTIEILNISDSNLTESIVSSYW